MIEKIYFEIPTYHDKTTALDRAYKVCAIAFGADSWGRDTIWSDAPKTV